jgi:signal transduction histidine kinase
LYRLHRLSQVPWDPTLYTVIGVAAAVLFFVIAIEGWQYRSDPAAKAFLGLISALGGWSLVYGIQLGFTALGPQLAWQRVALAIGGPVPSLWFLFALRYTNRESWLTRPVRAFVILDPILFGLLTLTNPSHGLVWHDASMVTYGALSVADLSFGPGYFFHLAYTYVVTPVAFGLIVVAAARSTLYRTQAALLALGSIPALVANATFSLGVDWAMAAVDFTPFAFVLTGPCFGLALFEFDLLERVPVARQRIVSESDDGFVVLDENDRIVSVNPTAERILDDPVEGGRLRESLPESVEPGADSDCDPGPVVGTTLTAVTGGSQRVYDLSRSTLTDDYGRDAVGSVLRFRDVTDRHRYQRRLKVANRVMRHDLRNRMNVITGWAERLRDDDRDEVATAGREIRSTASALVELGDQVRLLVETADYGNGTTERVDLSAHLPPLIDGIRRRYPDATVEADLPAGAPVVVPSARLLSVAVENLLENAVEHNDADRPRVDVAVDPATGDDRYTRLSVADDGPVIPEPELAVLRKGVETPLEHGSGIGLWLVHWAVTAAGGDVTFERTEPRGNVVTLVLPAAE